MMKVNYIVRFHGKHINSEFNLRKWKGTMLGKKIRYWAMCFVLGYIENGQKKFAKDSDMYKAYEKVILDVQGKYKYR